MGAEPADGEMRKSGSTAALIVLIALAGVALVCCGIGAVVLPPAIQQAREARRREQAAENLRQIGLALESYRQEYARPLAPNVPVSQSRIGEFAVQFKDEWLKEHPDEKAPKPAISNIEKTADGWHVTFEGVMPSPEPESESRHCLHVYIKADGTLIQVIRGPDVASDEY